ncbi:acetolactate synthase-1/2/3 large subunit [Variovorax sp. YR216]|nr:acetolactate synthase-1/2/3 large subunit [Variovorax sp. YR216]
MEITTKDPAPTGTEEAPASLRNGAERLLDALVEGGVDTLFGYPGGAALPLYDALHGEPRLRHILVRHEQAAVHAAEGYARTTGKVGVVLVTSGPGVSNTITGLLDAMSDSVPVLCISGQVATSVIGTNAFQESDALGMSRPVTKWNFQVRSAAQVSQAVREALAIAKSGRPGPVLLDVPKDVQLARADGLPTPDVPRARATPSQPAVPRGSLQRAADLISTARRPVFYGGGGLVNSGPEACAAFTRLVRATGAPCTLTLMGLGAFPASDPQWLGMLGMHGTLEANLAMHEADLVVNVGARFDDRVTGKLDEFCPHARKIHIDIDPSSIHKTRCAPMCRSWATADRCWAACSICQSCTASRPNGSRHGGSASRAGAMRAAWTSPRARTRSCRSSSWPRCSRGCKVAMPSSPPTWASTRCGPRSTCASSGPRAG